MRKDEIKSQILTIPNILTFIRMASIPFFIWLTVDSRRWVAMGSYSFPLIGFIIMMLAAATDLVDGYIARKFDQATALGAALDPVADKLMHISTLLSLVVIGFVHWAFLIVILMKEMFMIVGGALVLKYAQPIKANMAGKVASATLSAGVFLAFFHTFFAEKVFYLDWIIIGVAVVLTYYAFAGYIKQVIPVYKTVFKALKEGKDPNDYFSAQAEGAEEAKSERAETADEDKADEIEISEDAKVETPSDSQDAGDAGIEEQGQ